MMKWESSLRAWVSKNVIALGYIAVSLIGLYIRYKLFPFMSDDMIKYNIPWYDAIRTAGMRAAADASLRFNYTPLFLYFWCLLAKLLPNADTAAVLKAACTAVELLFSGACFMLCRELLIGKRRKLRRFAAFALIFLNPMVILNGSCWGQTDAFYGLFCIAAIIMYHRGKPIWSILMLGIAFSWKQQTIFIVPLFIILYFCGKNRFSALWFLLIPASLIISGLPMLHAGQSPLFAAEAYLKQIGQYKKLTYNYPNIFGLMGEYFGSRDDLREILTATGIVLCIAAIGSMAVFLIRRRALIEGRDLLPVGAWCILCCTFLLPRMHDRYGFVGEILLLLWAVCGMRPRGFAYVLLGTLAVLSAYSRFLFDKPFFPLQVGSVLSLLLLCSLTYEIWLSFCRNGSDTDNTGNAMRENTAVLL